jgi:MFS family permease
MNCLLTQVQVWHLFACQGILVGIGSGILLYVLAPILTEYFPQRPGLAQGAMYAGEVQFTKSSQTLANSHSWSSGWHDILLCEYGPP